MIDLCKLCCIVCTFRHEKQKEIQLGVSGIFQYDSARIRTGRRCKARSHAYFSHKSQGAAIEVVVPRPHNAVPILGYSNE